MILLVPLEDVHYAGDYYWQSSLSSDCSLEENTERTESKLMKLFQMEEKEAINPRELLPSDLLDAINGSDENCNPPQEKKENYETSLVLVSQSLNNIQKSDPFLNDFDDLLQFTEDGVEQSCLLLRCFSEPFDTNYS